MKNKSSNTTTYAVTGFILAIFFALAPNKASAEYYRYLYNYSAPAPVANTDYGYYNQYQANTYYAYNTPQYYYQNLNVTCYPSNSSIYQNGAITWYASVSGGNGSYSYTWSGTDGLAGSGSGSSAAGFASGFS